MGRVVAVTDGPFGTGFSAAILVGERGQAARRYSWTRPPRRSTRWICRICSTLAGNGWPAVAVGYLGTIQLLNPILLGLYVFGSTRRTVKGAISAPRL
jgi:hypothetical protein